MNKTEEFIEKARKVHGDKYDYSKVQYINSKQKVCIICPRHGEFWQVPNNHLTGYGCSKCGREAAHSKMRLTTKEVIKKFIKIHGNYYDYSKVQYVNEKTPITIICPKHGEFQQTPDSHIHQKAGCPKCARIKSKHKQLKTNEQFIQDARRVHGDIYDYSQVNYQGANIPIVIICKEHGEFYQTPHHHLASKAGCPYCSLKSQTKLFNKLQNDFSSEEILFEVGSKTIPWLKGQRFDIYFPKYNIAIEYNGKQHYIPIKYFGGELAFSKTINRDKVKKEKCILNNCTLLQIKYDYTDEDYQNLVKTIHNLIKNYENNS